MKRGDPESIKSRWLGDLKQKPSYKNIQKDGAIEQFIEAGSEPISEAYRYGEMMLMEMKWDTSKNFSSIKHQARLVGKKLGRKHSAVGTIITSHSDTPTDTNLGTARYENLGVSILDIDQESDYDNLVQDVNAPTIAKQALVPYWSSKPYSIPVGAVYTAKNGLSYVCAERKVIERWSSKWSTIRQSKDLLTEFRASGGWEGYKYLTVPIVQGQQKIAYLGESDNTACQSFVLSTLDIEAADSYYTKQFLYAEVETKDGVEIWKEVYHLSTVGCTDRYFEVNILDDMSGTEIKFGDGINGAIPPDGAKITLHYLETAGAAGNVYDLYSFNSAIDGVEIPDGLNISVGCQNMWAIIGGEDLETRAQFKRNAESAYAKNYEIIHTYTEFGRQINLISPVPLLKSRVKAYLKATKVNNSTVYTPTIGVTGLSGNLAKLNVTENAIFNKVINDAINNNIISNKEVCYVAPNIFTLNSHVSIELKESVLSEEDYKSDMVNYLQEVVGKYNLDNIEDYQQVTLIRHALEHSKNIAAIDCVDLVTFSDPKVELIGKANDTERSTTYKTHIAFNWTLPNININNFGAEGHCLKNAADGNVCTAIININVCENKFTFAILDNKITTDGVNPINFINADGDTAYELLEPSGSKYSIKQLKTVKTTFNRRDLRHPDTSLAYDETASSTQISYGLTDEELIKLGIIKDQELVDATYFSFSPSATGLTATLAIPVNIVASWVGYNQASEPDKVLNELQNKLSNNVAKCSVGFEPTDKTMSTDDWNTIWYYDDISCSID